MHDSFASGPEGLSISAIERDTGVPKDTLRVWERRYGFPLPVRDAQGERLYSHADLERLRMIRRLMDAGHRPGKIIGLSVDELRRLTVDALAPAGGKGTAPEVPDDLRRFIDLIKAHDVEALRTSLSQAALRMGLDRFVKEVSAPLNALVGEAWASGQLEVFEEHLYTESLQVVLRNSIGTIPTSGSHSPRVLLTTFPGEVHGLGLLMAEALLALDGCRCSSLGTQTPVWDIVRAASVKPIDIVALSFSACLNANQVLDGLTELRARLPATVDVWAGGRCPVLHRRPPAGVTVLPSLSDIAPAVRQWRAARQDGLGSGASGPAQPAERAQATNSDSTPV